MEDSKSLYRLTFKRLVKHCARELKKRDPSTLTEEQIVLEIFRSFAQRIHARTKEKTHSLRFSDFLKEENYVDHNLFMMTRELNENEKIEKPKEKIRTINKFGIFNVQKNNKKKKVVTIKPKKLTPEEADRKLKDTSL